jgi:hypothetical protein
MQLWCSASLLYETQNDTKVKKLVALSTYHYFYLSLTIKVPSANFQQIGTTMTGSFAKLQRRPWLNPSCL